MRLIVLFVFSILITCFNHIHSQTAEEQEMLNLVNSLRQERGLQAVQLNTALNQAAYDHSLDMAVNDYFSHTGLNGSSFSQRAINAGYTGSPRGENIAAGNSTAQATFNQWVNSTGHLNNMLNNDVNEMGIGHAYDSSSTYRHYWTQIFGKGDVTLSDDDFTAVDKLEIYPNPIGDRFNIKLKDINASMIDLKMISVVTGQTVYQKTKNLNGSTLSIDTERLPSGIYILYIQQLKASHKVIKL